MRLFNLRYGLVLATLGLWACPPPYPRCQSDEQCTEKGEVCVQGMCRECAKDDNCKPGFVCQENRCVPRPECTGDAGCGPGKKCQGGKCLIDPDARAPGACTTNDDCPSGEECKGGRCTPVPPSDDVKCTYLPIRFGFNDVALSAEAQASLGALAECIKRQAAKLVLEGHADERGTEEYNMVLSQRRAASVRKYLLDLGVTPGALDTVGFGENRPADEGHDEGAWAANRRVELRKR